MSQQASATPPRFSDPAAFETWVDQQPERWELHDGVTVAMAPERADHVRIKAQCWLALRNALRFRALPCEALIDGLMVPGPGVRRFQPDVLVACGERVRADAHLTEKPVIVVEVLSPSTEVADMSTKLESYFQLPSVQHYLLVSSTRRLVMHHGRLQDDTRLLTTLHTAGPVDLAHPGITITVEDIYEDITFD